MRVKRTTVWDGYKVHFTETCGADAPHLVVFVATTAASVDDATMTEPVHQGLARRGMTLAEHYVDCGYTSAKLILQARADGIDLIGPVKQAGGHQAHSANGYAATDFHIDWETRQAACPQGKTSSRWIETRENGEPRVHIDFYRAGCPTCPAKALCTTAAYRGITPRTREQHEVLETRRRDQHTTEWKQRYNTRAGVEGTMSQAVCRTGVRRARYRGAGQNRPRTRLHRRGPQPDPT